MEQFMAMTGRSLKLYFRDKGAVFFSLLSMIIVICLMVFFLGDTNLSSTLGLLSDFAGRDAAADEKNVELLILAWTSAGLLSINAVTVTQAVYSVMIKDRVNGKLNSIYTAPVSRGVITASYIATAWTAAVIMCSITLFITEIYGVIMGMEWFTFTEHAQLLVMIMVNSFAYAAIIYLLAMLAKTEGAWTGIGTVIGTLVGFLGGIYIPIGGVSDTIEAIMKCTPIIYGASMFRRVMTKNILETTFLGVPSEVVEEYRAAMGIDLTLFDHVLGIPEECLMLLACGMIFLVIGIIVLKYVRKTDR